MSPSSPNPNGESFPEAELALAGRIREVTLEIEGVVDIGRGILAEVATRWPGEKVVGVAVEEDSVEVHVVAEYPRGFPVATLDKRLREALAPLIGGRRLDIVIDDLAVGTHHGNG